MKYLKLYESFGENKLYYFLDHWGISDGNIDVEFKEDGSIKYINVENQEVEITNSDLTKIPFKFGTVYDNFLCNDNKLTTLENVPYSCAHFNCSNNQLTSLEFSPDEIMGSFDCSVNKITNLKYSPKLIYGDFIFSYNPIYDLKDFDTEITEGGQIYFDNTPISNITSIDELSYEDFLIFKELFDKAVNDHKVKMSLLKYIYVVFNNKPPEDLKQIVIDNGYEII